jgi:acyl-CoA synthetase (AMP-forming)/AMP-acid ligase II
LRATAEEILDFVRDRLAHYKCPDAVEFGLPPKTSAGQVQKYVLRAPKHSSRTQPQRRASLGVVGLTVTRCRYG